MATGLYELIRGYNGNKELTAEVIDLYLSSNDIPHKDRERLLKLGEELKFWEEYGEIYFNLEKARPYKNLLHTFKDFCLPKTGDIWLDVGSGPLNVSELIYKKSEGKVKSIEAIDVVLGPAREKLARFNQLGISLPINLRYASITDHLLYPKNYFDGIGANLILSYVIDFCGKQGREALVGVLQEMLRVLKPGGHLVWSTPKSGVNFFWVFLASIPDMLNPSAFFSGDNRISQGIRIFKHALEIQRKGKRGIYTFLSRKELEALLSSIGFINPAWEKSFAKQVWINRVYKPVV